MIFSRYFVSLINARHHPGPSPLYSSAASDVYKIHAQNGVYVRMALILTLLGLAPSGPLAEQALSAQRAAEATGAPCRNPRCITVAEEELVPLYVPDAHGVPRCVYCEHKMP